MNRETREKIQEWLNERDALISRNGWDGTDYGRGVTDTHMLVRLLLDTL